MRKWSLFLILAVLCIGVVAILTWSNRENILAHLISRQLHVPVTIRSLGLNRAFAEISRLWIGNFQHSQTTTSFTAETLKIGAKLNQLFSRIITIEEISIDDIFVGIEFYNAQGTDSNWTRMLRKNDQQKAASKDYLIKTLILRNLTVELVQADGQTKRYPTIKQMEFHNISSETGFPVDEIEKAIFNLMMQDLYKKLQIELFKAISPVQVPLLFQ